MPKKGLSRFSIKDFFCFTRSKKIVRNPSVLCFRKFPVANKLMDKRGEASIKFFRRKFFVARCRKKSRESHLVFHKLRVSKNVRVERRARGS